MVISKEQQRLRVLQEKFEKQLAEYLLKTNRVPANQLEEALSLQVVMGGHLSTNLWDIGVGKEDEIRQISAQLLDVPVVDMSQLIHTPTSILAMITATAAKSTKIIPLARSSNTLSIATCEPWNLGLAEQLSFKTSCQIRFVYMTEVDHIRFLHQHYSVPLSARVQLGPQASLAQLDASLDTADDNDILSADLMSESTFNEIYAHAVSRKDGQDNDNVNSINTDSAINESRITELPLIELTAADEIKSEIEYLEPIKDLNIALKQLEKCLDRDALGILLTRFALSRGKRVVLLIHQRHLWTGWIGGGQNINKEHIRSLIIPAEAGTAFGLVEQTGAHYLGPLSSHRIHRAFLHALGTAKPKTIGLFPVYYRGKIVFGIYLDSGDKGYASTDIADILLLAQKVPHTLAQLVKRRMPSIYNNE